MNRVDYIPAQKEFTSQRREMDEKQIKKKRRGLGRGALLCRVARESFSDKMSFDIGKGTLLMASLSL